jgi:hypothetical protein
MTARLLVMLGGLAAAALIGSTAVKASCAVSGPSRSVADEIASVQVVFVGSVIYTTDNNRTARVRVESIWKGPAMPAYVDVHGEAPGSGPFSGSEGDHHFQAGQKYVFVPLIDRAPFEDYGDCNISTQPFTAKLAANGTPNAKPAAAPTTSDLIWNFMDQYLGQVATVGLLILLGISVSLMTTRRRASAGHMRRR